MIPTIDQMRSEVARLIGLEPDEIGDDDNLTDLGLDSMRLMQLALGWEQAGVDVDFARLAEHTSLRGWHEALSAPRTGI